MTETTKLKTEFATPGFLRRLLVMLYDGVVVIALLMLATLMIMFFYSGQPTAGKDFVYTAFLFCVWFIYLDWCWRNGGLTLGMRAWKVRLVPMDGNSISRKQSLIRFTASMLSSLPLFLGHFWMLLDPQNRTWHDRLSDTQLISDRAPKNQDRTR